MHSNRRAFRVLSTAWSAARLPVHALALRTGRARALGLAAAVVAPLLALGTPPVGAIRPIAVAPGKPAVATPASACPSFHWGGVEAAVHHEIVVYRLAPETEGEPARSAELVLSESVPGSARSWAPALDRCLERGAMYSWSVRAISGVGSSEWADPLFFRVEELPTLEEVARALDVLRRHEEMVGAAERLAYSGGGEVQPTDERDLEVRFAPEVAIPPPTYSGGGAASIKAVGEVRTVDASGQPRLWGRGRPATVVWGRSDDSFCSVGTTRFGLSQHPVEWGSAAEACPEGTWVCRSSEISTPCDTARPDFSTDFMGCAGVGGDYPADNHAGWVADASPHTSWLAAAYFFETTGGPIETAGCVSMPVWCCF